MDRFETFSLALFNMSRYWNRLAAEEMEKYGLKGAHAFYLVTILRHDGDVTASQLCELCGKDIRSGRFCPECEMRVHRNLE